MSNIDTVAYLKAGRMFTASNVSAKIITVVGTAMTGLVLYNPLGSNKMLSLMSAGFSLTTALGSISSIGVAISPVIATAPSFSQLVVPSLSPQTEVLLTRLV